MPTVADVLAVVERLWPAAGAEPWDAVGLVAGDPGDEVRRILLAVDAVLDTADEAVGSGADLLIAHHPPLLRGVTSIAGDRYKGAMLTHLIRGHCALIAAHTNADVVESGTSAALADRLGLVETTPIAPSIEPGRGIGVVGTLREPISLGRLARHLGDVLPPTAGGIRVAGAYDREVRSVAICAGAGDAYLSSPAVLAADVYVTSDLRHHPASEARENARVAGGPALVDVSHWASEWLWLATAAGQLAEALPGVSVAVSDMRTDPWDFAVVQ